MLEIRYYLTEDGDSPFADWFASLDPIARAKVATAIARMEQGNLSNAKPIGQGVLEYRIDFGPGYRLYFGRDGEVLVILLTGGTKKRQQRDIKTAAEFWRAYRQTRRSRQ
jgi:putative addiction module killer protein